MVMVLIGWAVMSVPVGFAIGAMFRVGSGHAHHRARTVPAVVPVPVDGRRARRLHA